MSAVYITMLMLGAVFGRSQAACDGPNCAIPPTVKAAVKTTAAKATLPAPPVPMPKPKADPTPFPGPPPTAPRVLYVYDNGVVWDQSNKVWNWQGPDGTWYHQP
jgi:hypothetical protein